MIKVLRSNQMIIMNVVCNMLARASYSLVNQTVKYSNLYYWDIQILNSQVNKCQSSEDLQERGSQRSKIQMRCISLWILSTLFLFLFFYFFQHYFKLFCFDCCYIILVRIIILNEKELRKGSLKK